MEKLKNTHPNLNSLLFNEIFKDKKFDYILNTDKEFFLIEDEKILYYEFISEFEDYILGENDKKEFIKLTSTDINTWEEIIENFNK